MSAALDRLKLPARPEHLTGVMMETAASADGRQLEDVLALTREYRSSGY